MSWSINLNTVIMLNTWEIWTDYIYISIKMPSFFCVYCLQYTQVVYIAFSIHKCAFWFCVLFCFDFIFFLVFMNVKTKISRVTCLEESFFHCLFMRPLSEISWLWVCESFPWVSVLGHWSTWLSYAVPTVIWLQYKQVWCVTIIVVRYILYNLYG